MEANTGSLADCHQFVGVKTFGGTKASGAASGHKCGKGVRERIANKYGGQFLLAAVFFDSKIQISVLIGGFLHGILHSNVQVVLWRRVIALASKIVLHNGCLLFSAPFLLLGKACLLCEVAFHMVAVNLIHGEQLPHIAFRRTNRQSSCIRMDEPCCDEQQGGGHFSQCFH